MRFMNVDEFIKARIDYYARKYRVQLEKNIEGWERIVEDVLKDEVKGFKRDIEYLQLLFNSQIYEPHDIHPKYNPDKVVFSIVYNETRYMFTIDSLKNLEDEFNNSPAEFVCMIYTPNDSYITNSNIDNNIRTTMAADVYSISQIEKLIAFSLDIDEPLAVHLNFEDEVTEVFVHKVTGLPLYYFHTEGVKHVVTIERNPGENRDYIIRICSSGKDNGMLNMSAVKTGKLFRTVLLKRLNDWYKEKYQKRATFKWGANVNME